MAPKLAINGSCDKFEKETGKIHIKYTRNNKIYCRIKSRFAKKRKTVPKNVVEHEEEEPKKVEEPKKIVEPEPKKVEEPKKVVDSNINRYAFCKESTEEQLKHFAYLLSETEDYSRICDLFHKMKFQQKPTLKQIKLVAKTLGINLTNNKEKKGKDTLIKEIKSITDGNLVPSFKRWVDMHGDLDRIDWMVLILANIILPQNFSEHTELPISETQYKHYLKLLGREKAEKIKAFFDGVEYGWQHIDEKERPVLNECLKRKFSSCVSKFAYRNRALSLVKGMHTKKFEPSEFCKSQVLSRSTGENQFIIPYNRDLIKYCDVYVLKDIGVKSV